MIDRARESRNPKKVIRVTLMESYGEIGRVPVNLFMMHAAGFGAAMGNAPENVRRRAPMVIGKNDEEGLLKRLKEIFKD